MAIRTIFPYLLPCVGLIHFHFKPPLLLPFYHRTGMNQTSEQFQNERARSLLNDLTQLAWNRSRQDTNIATINVANIGLYDENNTIFFFYSGKLSYRNSPKEIGNTTIHNLGNITIIQMPFTMDTMQYVSQYWRDDKQKESNHIEANIIGVKGIVEVTKKLNSTESQLIVTDSGKFIYKLNGELQRLSLKIELGLHKEIIKSFETST